MTDAKSQGKLKAYQIFTVLYMGIGSICYGYAMAIIGTTLGQPSFQNYMKLTSDTNSSSALTGAIVSLFYVGGFVGSFVQGWVSNRWGRKASIIMGCIMVIISGAFLSGSVNPGMFIAFRFFNGWGATQLNCSIPLWITEISAPRHRAMMTVVHSCGINLGNNIAGFVGIGFYWAPGTNQWRGPIALQIVPAVILLCGIVKLPESPRYLLSRGRTDEAWVIIQRLHADNGGNEFAEREFYQIQMQNELDSARGTSYLAIFRRPSYRTRALLTIYFVFSLMSVGALVINSYGTYLYSSLGFDTIQSLFFETGWTMVGTFANLLSMMIVDRVKRNVLFSIGFALILICLIAEAVLEAIFLVTTNRSGLSACVAIFFIYNFFYGIFLESAPFFFIGEIWPTHLRAQGYAMGIGSLCVTVLLWVQLAPTAFASIGWRFYIVFMVFALISSAVTALFFPDTLHKPLEEIAAVFGDTAEVAVFQNDLQGVKMDILPDTKERPTTVHDENIA